MFTLIGHVGLPQLCFETLFIQDFFFLFQSYGQREFNCEFKMKSLYCTQRSCVNSRFLNVNDRCVVVLCIIISTQIQDLCVISHFFSVLFPPKLDVSQFEDVEFLQVHVVLYLICMYFKRILSVNMSLFLFLND